MFEKSGSTSLSSSRPLVANRPTRGSERNQNLVNKADPSSDDLLLPSLNDGITLLDVDGSRGVPILQSLVLDHLLSMTDLRSGPTQMATRRRPNSPRSNHQNPLSAALFRIDLEQESRLLNSSNMPKEGSGWSDRVHGGGILICRSTRTQYICDKTYRSQFGRSDDHERDRATSRNQRSGGHRNVE